MKIKPVLRITLFLACMHISVCMCVQYACVCSMRMCVYYALCMYSMHAHIYACICVCARAQYACVSVQLDVIMEFRGQPLEC